MAGEVGGRVLIAMLLVLGLLQNAAATVYTVGQPGSNGGWTFVTSGESYDEQFNNTNLVVGDVLSFVFVTGDHNVLVVPAADVSTCNVLSATQTFSSSVNITLTTTGSHGFICGFPGHCDNSGMQLLVTVNASAAPGAAPVASPVASPVTSPVASPVASSPPAPPAPPATGPATAPEEFTIALTKGSNTASVLQSGPAMAMGALLAACAVLAF